MRHNRGFFTLLLFVSFSLIATGTLVAQDSKVALQRGYRTGYSDGYMAGYRDSIDNAAKDIRRHSEYSEAKRAYNTDYGTLEDYSDGYRQGFESGYDTGFEKRSFDSALPTNLSKRGAMPEAQPPVASVAPAPVVESAPIPASATITEPAVIEETPAPISAPQTEPEPAPAAPVQPTIQKVAFTSQSDDPIIIIPRDTELIIEIQEPLSTETSSIGDKFTAKIMSPHEITGAVIEGRIERITKPGRLKRRAELLLTFDRIVISDQRWSNYSALVTEVLPIKGDNVKTVDAEGAAIGRRSIKEDAIKVGITTGAGLGIGALTAGPVGAAVGAGVGAAFGVGAVVIERGKHIQLNQNQQLRIRTSFETKIR